MENEYSGYSPQTQEPASDKRISELEQELSRLRAGIEALNNHLRTKTSGLFELQKIVQALLTPATTPAPTASLPTSSRVETLEDDGLPSVYRRLEANLAGPALSPEPATTGDVGGTEERS